MEGQANVWEFNGTTTDAAGGGQAPLYSLSVAEARDEGPSMALGNPGADDVGSGLRACRALALTAASALVPGTGHLVLK